MAQQVDRRPLTAAEQAVAMRVLGQPIRSERPTFEENTLLPHYSADGYTLSFASSPELLAFITNPIAISAMVYLSDSHDDERPFPATIRLNFPWAIGAARGQTLSSAVQHALVIQVSKGHNPCVREPPASDPSSKPLCRFSEACLPGTPQYEPGVVRQRMEAHFSTLPVFAEPRLFAVPVKRGLEISPDGTHEIQYWRPFQFCANCRAGRKIGWCTHFYYGLFVYEGATLTVPIGQPSVLDTRYPPDETNTITDAWLAEDGPEH